VDKGDAIAGAIVAQDPGTGGVLALVSYPSFDPNTLSEGLSQEEFNKISQNPAFPFFNRVISATYPPGSVFKMVMASAVLAENLISEHYQINDKGFISVGEFIFRNWKLDGHGLVDLRRALQVSNDTYFYTVGGGYGGVPGLGIEKISEWSKKFGYGSKTGINLQGEEGGFVPDGSYRDWYLGDTYITSIGQGDMLATPLQVNQITSYFANGGYLLKPQIVKKIEGAGETDVEVISQFLISEEAYEIVREGLNLAVSPGGTGYPVYDIPDKFEGVTLGGKTGTSEFGGPDSDETHAWFTVFGPMDKATIALTVFLEGGGEGSHDAAPIARELLDLWFSK
jgi:penicillin-binding protein 2